MDDVIEAPVRLELIGKGGTAIWCGDRIIASMAGARSDHRSARQDAEEIVRRFNAHDELLRVAILVRDGLESGMEKQSFSA